MTARISFQEIPIFSEKNSIVGSTVREVFKNLRENYQKFGKVTDQDLLALSSVFDETLEKSLQIVEGSKVTYFYTKANVGVYQVEGSSSKIYTIFPSVNYCSCPSYKYQVSNGSQITCKHVLATVLADAISTKISVEVSGYMMNDRKDWNNANPYLGQFMSPNPLPEIPPTFSSIPEVAPSFGVTPSDWAHVPPQTMPWGTPPETQPTVVKFTAGDFNPHMVPVKRKCDVLVDPLPSKMLVTEEKMAAHMRDLHISDVETSQEVSSITCKEEPMESDRLPKLVLSDEIKNLKTESIIPESILKKLEKPGMALVLWQPPATDLNSKIRELKKLSVKKPKESEKENKNEIEMDVAIENEMQNNANDNVFRPIDPVPMPYIQNQFFQPVPQFHEYSPFSADNFQS